MKNKKEFSRYNDGVISIYREKKKESGFSAKKNVTTTEDMDFVAKLSYEELSKREKDLEFAQQNDFTLSMKVKTRFLKVIDNKCKAVIDGYLYDISFLDKTKSEMFFYLEGVKPIDS